MDETFQRLFARENTELMSLNAQAALGPVRQPKRSQVSHLIRHFLERFFNHETASPDGDSKTRVVQIACATGLPGFMVVLYLWPVYHPFLAVHPGVPLDAGPPPYWLQVNHHFFFVLYSFVVLGIATVFEWDLFFPDQLDIFILRTLPIPERRVFLARIAAIGLFVGGFLLVANCLAPLAIPAVFDPPNLTRLLAGHLAAVAASGLFAAVFILAIQGLLLATLGDRLLRKVSLLLQGLSIASLLMLLLLFPVLSGAVPVFLQSNSASMRWFPPFWFLGIYQRILEGPSALPIYGELARNGCVAFILVTALAVIAYPLAYMRRVRQLVEGPGTRSTRVWFSRPLNSLLHVAAIRPPSRRAVFHFISQTLLRVPRYRIYLVLYGGVGLSVVVASFLRLAVVHSQVHVEISADGVRASIGIIAFWVIAGLRMAFVSSGNQRGSWIFRIMHGRPPQFQTAMDQLLAARIWALLCSGLITLGACLAFRAIDPPELLTPASTAVQLLVAAGMCLVLTDAFFLNVTIVAFTGEPPREPSNLAFSVGKYFAFFPLVASLPVLGEPWIEKSVLHFVLALLAPAGIHFVLSAIHRHIVRENCNLRALEEDEEDFPMRLGLRY